MLPSHFKAGGQTDADPRRLSTPLLEARKKYSKPSPPPTGLIFLTIACVLVLVFQLWVGTSSTRRTNAAIDGATPNQRRVLAAARRAARGGPQHEPWQFPAPHLRNLVLVACHSVYTGLDFKHAEEQSSWFLLDYQQEVPGQIHSFVQHIQLGVHEAAADPDALLLFSGGKTRRDAGPRAEGEGYWLVAEAAKWYGSQGVRERAFTEDKARDSFENLLFGLCRFYELTGHYPEFITVVGYDFKQRRFRDLHRTALRLPEEAFRYEGTPALNAAAIQGEEATIAAFAADPYACSAALAAKRAQRDPFAAGGYDPSRCPHMAELLTYCGPQQYDGDLPWDGTA
ncbi:hypothetical protein C2E20_5810 [Micractinium conductrix]|uniref:DUF218 domain-containing protein n=1 Tax=Micractinium conductrix TaxID=554055 RepID=A0A2P6V9D8_9CHLO|nr:hypothetical protein C2E20_5810 [Micractinium conductrix]|eukprot:PSC70695.1 hypothetical protein C2E20_5810 [Micractinium conductrix]